MKVSDIHDKNHHVFIILKLTYYILHGGSSMNLVGNSISAVKHLCSSSFFNRLSIWIFQDCTRSQEIPERIHQAIVTQVLTTITRKPNRVDYGRNTSPRYSSQVSPSILLHCGSGESSARRSILGPINFGK